MTLPDDETPPTLPGGDVPRPPRRGRGRPKGSKTKQRAVESTAAREQPHTHIAEVVADAKAEKRGRERSFLRAPHGAAKERGLPGPRVEVPPADELAPPVQIHNRPQHPGGPFRKGNPVAVLGGPAKKGKVALAATLGITADMAEQFPDELRRMLNKGASYRRARSSELARLAGGECGAGASTMVATASLSLAASRYVFGLAALEKDGVQRVKLFALYAKLADSQKQHELAAHSLAMLESKGRPNRGQADPFAGLRAPLPAPESNRAVRSDMDNTTSAVRASGPALTAPIVTHETTRTGQLEPLTSPVVVDASARTDEIDSSGGR